MNKKNRILLSICLGVILVFTLVGCGNDDPVREQSNAPSSNTEQEQPQENKTQEETNEKVDYSKYLGTYLDTKSQRATMQVKENTQGEGVTIHVQWSTSSSENLQWDMTGTPDGNRMVYADCVKTYHVYDSDNNETKNEKKELEPKGYFEISDGVWNWTGSPEQDCQGCSFAKQ